MLLQAFSSIAVTTPFVLPKNVRVRPPGPVRLRMPRSDPAAPAPYALITELNPDPIPIRRLVRQPARTECVGCLP
jgi:hypothetical protein